jgi:hypothetical protein
MSKPDETLAKVKTCRGVEQLSEGSQGEKKSWAGVELIPGPRTSQAAESKCTIEHNQLVWMYNLIRSLYVAKAYGSFEAMAKNGTTKRQ